MLLLVSSSVMHKPLRWKYECDRHFVTKQRCVHLANYITQQSDLLLSIVVVRTCTSKYLCLSNVKQSHLRLHEDLRTVMYCS